MLVYSCVIVICVIVDLHFYFVCIYAMFKYIIMFLCHITFVHMSRSCLYEFCQNKDLSKTIYLEQIIRDGNCAPQLLSRGMTRRSSEPLTGYSASTSHFYCLIYK